MKKAFIFLKLLIFFIIADGQNKPIPQLPFLPADSINHSDIFGIYHNFEWFHTTIGALDSNSSGSIKKAKATADTLVVNNRAVLNYLAGQGNGIVGVDNNGALTYSSNTGELITGAIIANSVNIYHHAIVARPSAMEVRAKRGDMWINAGYYPYILTTDSPLNKIFISAGTTAYDSVTIKLIY